MNQGTTTLSSSSICGMYDKPVLLLPPDSDPNNGYVIHSASFVYFKGQLPFSVPNGSQMVMQYQGTLYGKGPKIITIDCAQFLAQNNSSFCSQVGQSSYNPIIFSKGKGIYLSNTVGNISNQTNDCSLQISIWFDVINMEGSYNV
jgi:hypothetical protein